MNLKKCFNLTIIILTAIILGSVPSLIHNIQDNQDYKANEFAAPIDLTDDDSVKSTIISYLINRDNDPEDPVKVIDQETLESDYHIDIELGLIKEMNETSPDNHTLSIRTRHFTASYIDNAEPHIEIRLSGWVDEYKKVSVWDGLTIIRII